MKNLTEKMDKPFQEQEGMQAGVWEICVYNMTY